jgi:hypothetical protein
MASSDSSLSFGTAEPFGTEVPPGTDWTGSLSLENNLLSAKYRARFTGHKTFLVGHSSQRPAMLWQQKRIPVRRTH